MALLPLIRLITLATVLVFAVIVLALSAHLTSLTERFFDGYFVFAAMGIAVSILTLLTFPVLIAVDFLRKGAFTSMVVVELSWLGVLWVLWLTTGALAANINFFGSSCDYINSDINTACHEFSAIEAFSFLNWIILLAYTITLFVFALIGANRGHRVWTSSVRETNFLAPPTGTNVGTSAPQFEKPDVAGHATSYPPTGHQVQPSLQSVPHPAQSPYPQV